jgi:hypothetical protein
LFTFCAGDLVNSGGLHTVGVAKRG